MNADRDELRKLPSIERVVSEMGPLAPHRSMVRAARRAVDEARRTIERGDHLDAGDIVVRARELIDAALRSRLQPVINATGVLIHTNLGRVPLSDTQLDAVAAVSSGYSNLEYDVVAGRRGSRHEHAADILCEITGAEAALVVNNNAAGVLVALAALCEGREVIVSRGELVEIGGGFRIPDVLRASGARLTEVGTTNRTHLADYEKAIGPDTAAILKVHPSNYRVVGFTASVPATELAATAHGRDLILIHDLGSGLLAADEHEPWIAADIPAPIALEDGADVVTFSGDKLMGGPQAGVIVGRRELVERIRRHPLMRAIRPDKMTLAALEATAAACLAGDHRSLPLWEMALAPEGKLAERAEALRDTLADLAGRGTKIEALASEAVMGGGALPGERLASHAVAVEVPGIGPDELDRRFRGGAPPVIGRIADGRFLLDLRTIDPADDALLADRIRRATAPTSAP